MKKGVGYYTLYHLIAVLSTFHTPQIATPHPKGSMLLVYII